MRGTVRFFIWGFLCALWFAGAAGARFFEGVPESDIETVYVTSRDGVVTKLIHLRNPERPIALLEPGIAVQATSFEARAADLYHAGFEVFIGNWRGAAALPNEFLEKNHSLAAQNGLREIMLEDFPAHLRHVLRYASPAQRARGIALIGHSMGGMMIAGGLSNPKIAEEFRGQIRAIVLLDSAHHLKNLPFKIRILSKLSLPALRTLKALGFNRVPIGAKTATAIGKDIHFAPVAKLTAALVRMVLGSGYSNDGKLNEALAGMPADAMPIDLLLDLATIAAESGSIPGTAPARITRIPVQLVRTRYDSLAPWDEQQEYFRELGAKTKQLLSLEGMNHTDPLLFTRPEANFFPLVLKFLRFPLQSAQEQPQITFWPSCENLLL
jgi:alpha-beta hydrolase superfamily lysophospholipase